MGVSIKFSPSAYSILQEKVLKSSLIWNFVTEKENKCVHELNNEEMQKKSYYFFEGKKFLIKKRTSL